MAERRDTKKRLLWKGEYQNADGRYMYRYVDSKGIPRFVYSWTLTQTDRTPKGKKSGKCLRELEKEIAGDLRDEIDTFEARKMTLNSFYTDYIAQRMELKPTTRTNYKYMYRKYVWDTLGKMKLSDIRFSDVKKFYNRLIHDMGFKPSSTEIIHTLLHPVFATAVRDGYIRVNPTDGVMAEIRKSNDWEKPKRRALTVQQQEAFVEFVRTHEVFGHWMPIITVLLGTGCRIGEVIGLTWHDCDFRNNIISINHILTYKPEEETRKNVFHVSSPKTKSGKREIPMFDAVRAALVAEYSRQMQSGFSETEIDGYSGFVFLNRHGKVFAPSDINMALARIIRSYNTNESEQAMAQNREPSFLPHFSVHSLRHTFCTRMCENETNIKVIQEIMGHSDISVTMDVYAEATLDKKRESFSMLDQKIMLC